jgi:hypothetical protein
VAQQALWDCLAKLCGTKIGTKTDADVAKEDKGQEAQAYCKFLFTAFLGSLLYSGA